MMLSDGDLKAALDDDTLFVSGYGDLPIQPASIDLRLAHQFQVFDRLNPDFAVRVDVNPSPTQLHEVPEDGFFELSPGQFALGCTMEFVELRSNLAARIEGKSSLGRHGLMVHSTAGFIDPGFKGQLTLELSNLSPNVLLLKPGMFVAQLCVFELKTPARKPYGSDGLGSRYQGQQGPTASRSWMG
jgi:dCTP deaminase